MWNPRLIFYWGFISKNQNFHHFPNQFLNFEKNGDSDFLNSKNVENCRKRTSEIQSPQNQKKFGDSKFLPLEHDFLELKNFKGADFLHPKNVTNFRKIIFEIANPNSQNFWPFSAPKVLLWAWKIRISASFCFQSIKIHFFQIQKNYMGNINFSGTLPPPPQKNEKRYKFFKN